MALKISRFRLRKGSPDVKDVIACESGGMSQNFLWDLNVEMEKKDLEEFK